MFLGLSLSSTPCLADPYSDLYNQASAAFEQGDFASAVILFNKAKNLHNSDDHALDFNIGSSLFKLGNYIAAYQAFDSASADPQFYVLSHINMALCAAKLQDRELLAKHLIIVAPLVTSNRYREQLVNIAQPFGLQDLLQQSKPRLRGQFDFAIGRQYQIVLQLDQNNSTITPATNTRADANYLYSGLNLNFHWNKMVSTQFVIQDVSYQSNQQQIKNYDYRNFILSPTFQLQSESSVWSASFSAIHTDLANRSFQNQTVILLKAMVIRGSWRAGPYLQHRSLYSTDSNYLYLQGREFTSGVLATRNTSHWSLSLDGSVSGNEREDFYSDINGDGIDEFVQSYSPRVTRLSLDTRYRLTARLSLLIDAKYQVDHYPRHQLPQRRDHQRIYSFGLQQEFNSRWQLLLNYQGVDHNSTNTLYEYNSHLMFLAMRYKW